ncbi:MAG: glycosyltransferase family 2 protein [Candidatus Omnitrophica bacterium]|nr:glycosyltransferase family 2 protein [Candidatus Omnitrophota bacterium]
MMATEPISIIIPNRNGSSVLGDLLQSIKEQNCGTEALEVIIIDDSSRDNSLEIVRTVYPEALILHNGKQKGAAYSRNRGIAAAHHTWLLFLDNDVVLTPQFISCLMREACGVSAACFQPKILFQDNHNAINSTGGIANMFGYAWDRGIYEEDTGQYDERKRIFFASSAAMLIRQEDIRAVGMFDADYVYLNEDFDVGYRLKMIGRETLFIPQAVCYHRMSHTMGRDNPTVKYLMERNRMITLLKNYEVKTLLTLSVQITKLTYAKYKTYLSRYAERKMHFVFAALKSWLWILVHMPMILIKRRAAQRRRSVSDKTIFTMMGEYQAYFPHFSPLANETVCVKEGSIS